MGLNEPFVAQYAKFVINLVTFDAFINVGYDPERPRERPWLAPGVFSAQSWDQPGITVGERLRTSFVPSMTVTLPAMFLTLIISICVGMISAFNRGRVADRSMVVAAVLGMSISYLVYIILGQYFGAFMLNEAVDRDIFAIQGYEGWGPFNLPQRWAFYCLLPVLISVVVAMGYDTRFYRAVMVEESGRDYITTARAKGASKPKIMFVHMLKNAMIPIITRVVISLPFLIMGSILVENFFNIPGMGRTLIKAVSAKDFPIIQALTAVIAALYIATIVLTDVLYALFDPRVRLS